VEISLGLQVHTLARCLLHFREQSGGVRADLGECDCLLLTGSQACAAAVASRSRGIAGGKLLQQQCRLEQWVRDLNAACHLNNIYVPYVGLGRRLAVACLRPHGIKQCNAGACGPGACYA
jgi:hypothetical protein